MMRVWIPLLALEISCQTSGQPPAKQADGAEVTARCIGNTAQSKDESALKTLRPDVEGICAALDRSPNVSARKPVVKSFSGKELEDELGEPHGSPGLLVYYTGHGGYEKGRPSARTRGGGSLPYRRLLDVMKLGEDGWATLIVNSCESSNVDLGRVSRASSIIASGYTLVRGSPTEEQVARQVSALPRSPFAEFATHGLEGAADSTVSGNCDGIVSDAELADYVNERLDDHFTDHWIEEQLRPTATLRSSTLAALPLAWVEGSQGCKPKELQYGALCEGNPKLPPKLCSAISNRNSLRRGESGSPTAGAGSYLVLRDRRAQGASNTFARALTPRLSTLGVDVIFDPAQQVPVAALAAAVDLNHLYVADVTDDEQGTYWWVSVVRARDGEEVATLSVPPDEKRLLEYVLRSVPRRIEAFDLGCSAVASTSSRCALSGSSGGKLWLRILGPVPRALSMVRWEDFIAGSSKDPIPLTASSLTAIPCPQHVGHCYEMSRPTAISGNLGEWLLIDGGSN